MKINWKVRIRNPQFWITVGLSVITPLFAYYGITGADLTTWQSVWTLIMDAVSNPLSWNGGCDKQGWSSNNLLGANRHRLPAIRLGWAMQLNDRGHCSWPEKVG